MNVMASAILQLGGAETADQYSALMTFVDDTLLPFAWTHYWPHAACPIRTDVFFSIYDASDGIEKFTNTHEDVVAHPYNGDGITIVVDLTEPETYSGGGTSYPYSYNGYKAAGAGSHYRRNKSDKFVVKGAVGGESSLCFPSSTRI